MEAEMHVEAIELPFSHGKRVVINLGDGMEHSVLPEQALQLAQWINELRPQMGLEPVAPNEVLEAYRHDADAIRLQMPPRSWSGTAIMHLWNALADTLRERDLAVAHDRQPYPRNALADTLRERDLAVAHDRQPYPTAWAYEQLAAAHAALQAKLEERQDKDDRLALDAPTLRVIGDDCERGHVVPKQASLARRNFCYGLAAALEKRSRASLPTEKKP